MKKTNQHDRRYKKLFSNPLLLKELLQSFIHEEFIHELDFSSLERLDKSFVTDNFKEKESDLIYRINFKDQKVYIFLLIEFQSKVDKFMALRMLRYICEFYEYLVQQKIKQLPPVFPILLYNGDARWTAQHNIKDLVARVIPDKYIPDFSYYPVLENEISKDTLLKIQNAVSAIFYIENSEYDELKQNIHKIVNLLMTENSEVVTLFKNWLNDLLGYKDTEILDSISEIEETHEMFATSLKKHDDELKHASKLEGKLEDALKMHEKGFSIQDIVDITGLSIEVLAENGIQ